MDRRPARTALAHRATEAEAAEEAAAAGVGRASADLAVSVAMPETGPNWSAAIRVYQGYRYTVAIIANGAEPHTAEAELWWQRASEPTTTNWTYFRRQVAATGAEAARKVENEFREWVDGQIEAEER
jgi:hypothetical protein